MELAKLHGLSVADVAARLRIRMKFVDGGEKEDWPTVGEFVYVRGFLKNYADLLGLDTGAAVARIARRLPNRFSVASRFSSARAATVSVRAFTCAAAKQTVVSLGHGSVSLTIAGVLVILVAISVFGLLSPSRQSAYCNAVRNH